MTHMIEKKNNQQQLILDFMKLYFVRACNADGSICGEPRVTDKENLETCIKYIKHDNDAPYAYVNHASMCFDGYLVNGDCVGKF